MEISIFDPLYLNEVGKRGNNEDKIYPAGFTSSSSRMFMVCDGVGGEPGGEIAATIVCDSISDYLLKNQAPVDKQNFMSALRYAEGQLSDFAARRTSMASMCSTLTFLGIGENGMLLCWVGDSKILHFRGEKLLFQSKDHSLVQEKVDSGELTEEEAEDFAFKNIITRVVGPASAPVEPEMVWDTDLAAGDFFFLVSDGILQGISVRQIGRLCGTGAGREGIHRAISKLCREKSSDNYSMYMVQIEAVKP